jgi:hypothetical protein
MNAPVTHRTGVGRVVDGGVTIYTGLPELMMLVFPWASRRQWKMRADVLHSGPLLAGEGAKSREESPR